MRILILIALLFTFTAGSFADMAHAAADNLNQLEGVLSHIHYIKELQISEMGREELKLKRQKAKKDKKRLELNSSNGLYSKFLFYKYFASPSAPLIMTEGKTDIIYLKSAIRQLSKREVYNLPHHPVNFFRHTKRVDDVMRIYEGASSLKNFITFYEKETKFPHFLPQFPIIILLDNDKEAREAVSAFKKKYNHAGEPINKGSGVCYHITKNLYLVVMPKLKGNDSAIENFFKDDALKIKLNEKVFLPENNPKFDTNKHFSKYKFASEVVQPMQEKIDFTNFVEILTPISEAIIDYDTRLKAK